MTLCPTMTTFDGPSIVRDGEILVRGVPIRDLIGSMRFADMIFLQLLSRLPDETERMMIDAYLVSLCEHGVTSPSTHGARVAASVRSPFGASAISFIAGAMGPYHFGALERAMIELRDFANSGESIAQFLDRHELQGERVWGFGHRFHRTEPASEHEPRANPQEDIDPRVRALFQIADDIHWDGKHLAIVREIGRELHRRKGIPINIDGIGAGILLDMGFTPEVALLFVIIGRLPNIARLHLEELDQTPNRFTALATSRDPGFDRTVDRDQHLPARTGGHG